MERTRVRTYPLTMTNTQTSALQESLSLIRKARVAVIGDLALDAYWEFEPAENETSLETGLPVRRIRRQRYAPGGAANVARSLARLGASRVEVTGVIGSDPFGDLLLKLLVASGCGTSHLLRQEEWQTAAYVKPLSGAHEGSRLDLGNFNRMTAETKKRLLKTLDELLPQVEVVVVNQQLSDAFLEKDWLIEWKALTKRHPATRILVDARKCAADFGAQVAKLNEKEARELVGRDLGPMELALESAKKMGCLIFLTRGDRGLVVAKASGECEIFPAVRIPPPVDPVGAGDTTVAALAAALAGGVDSSSAAKLAVLAAAVTVRKICETGAPTPEEILDLEKEADFIHLPDLAENPDRAHFLEASSIEMVSALPDKLEIRHAIFDHDGTLSTLRHGWESVMEPVMLRAILGKSFEHVAPEKKAGIRVEVKRFIEETTGIQTLAQMEGLAALVRRCGFVPKNEILDAHGYKKIYNDALMAQVNERRALLERGDLAPEDFQIKNARALLEALKSRGVRLYLASGTDVADVKDEAKAMGYADLFDGGIYGAIGRVDVEAKREVMDRIQREHQLEGRSLVVFGDGPVEIREGRRRGAACVGVGSLEASRHGIDLAKRTRLIRAGAHLVVPDFGSLEKLLQLLNLR